jgi:GT2 family glycosyltransferase
VFVSDNASTDGTMETMRAWAEGQIHVDTSKSAWDSIRDHPIEVSEVTYGIFESEAAAKADPTPRWLTVASTGGSKGFPAGNNVGMRYGLTRDYDYFWILNNDTVVEPTALVRLVAKMQSDPEIGICGSTLVFYARPDIVQAYGGCTFNPYTAESGCVGLGTPLQLPPPDRFMRSRHMVGAAMFASRACLEKVGLMNDELYLYFEEIDWTMRMEPFFKNGYEPLSIVYHKHGGTMGGGDRKKPSRHRVYYMTINRILFTRKHFPSSVPIVVAAILAQAFRNAVRGRLAISSWMIKDLLYGLTKAQYPLREIP